MNWELITALFFYALIGFYIYKNREKFEIKGILFIYRWKKAIKYIKKIARPDWLWKIFFTIGIPISIFFMIVSVDVMLTGVSNIIESPRPASQVTVLIPGVKLPGSSFYLPFWIGIISILVLAVVHETGHAISGIVDNIKLKSAGAGLLLFLPLAFVEPDEKELKKKGFAQKIRMFCAGSFSNFTFAFLLFLFISNFFNPFVNNLVQYEGVVLSGTSENYPARAAGMINGSIIYSVNNKSTPNLTSFTNAFTGINPNDSIVFNTSEGFYNISAATNPYNSSKGYAGVNVEQEWGFKKELLSSYPKFLLMIPLFFLRLLLWVVNLNFAVGLFNLYPLWITDGGKVLVELVNRIIKDEYASSMILNIFFIFFMTILLFNIFGPGIV